MRLRNRFEFSTPTPITCLPSLAYQKKSFDNPLSSQPQTYKVLVTSCRSPNKTQIYGDCKWRGAEGKWFLFPKLDVVGRSGRWRDVRPRPRDMGVRLFDCIANISSECDRPAAQKWLVTRGRPAEARGEGKITCKYSGRAT